jgi:hypothetical protein
MRYDRARKNLDRHPNYILAALPVSGDDSKVGSAWALRAREVLCLGVAESAPCP